MEVEAFFKTKTDKNKFSRLRWGAAGGRRWWMVALNSQWSCFWLSVRGVNKLVNGTDERHDRTHTHRLLPKTGLSRNTENSQQTVHKASPVWFPGFPKGTLDESRSNDGEQPLSGCRRSRRRTPGFSKTRSCTRDRSGCCRR